MLYVIRCNTISKVPHWKQSSSHKDTITQVYLETIKQFIARSKIGKERFEDVFPPFSWSSYTYEISVQRFWKRFAKPVERKLERIRGKERKRVRRKNDGYIRDQERRGRRDEVSKRPTVGIFHRVSFSTGLNLISRILLEKRGYRAIALEFLHAHLIFCEGKGRTTSI